VESPVVALRGSAETTLRAIELKVEEKEMSLTMHWGTFVKAVPFTAPNSSSVQVCLEIAETALRRFSLRVFDPADQEFDFAVGGIRDDLDVIVQVVCVPLDRVRTWIIVSATSTNFAMKA
jgi:hypothetical protein